MTDWSNHGLVLLRPQAYGKGVVSVNAAYIVDSRPLRHHQGGAAGGGAGGGDEAALAGVVLTTEELVAVQVMNDEGAGRASYQHTTQILSS